MLSYLFANRMNDTRNFRYIDWESVKNTAQQPYSCEKLKTPIIGMHDAKAKTKTEVLKNDHMTLLWLDIDKNSYTLDEVSAAIQELGIKSFIIYSTISATPDQPRWRVFIELASSLCCDKWIDVQAWLVELFDGDSCATGIQQIAFLPNKFSGHYEYFINGGPAFDPAGLNLPEPVPVPVPAAPQPRFCVVDSPIAAYNKNNDVSNLLSRYGFKQRGKKWIYPGSQSGLPGVKILDGKYYSHHSNDPLSDGLAHDAFDLFVEYEHHGSRNAALKAAAKQYVEHGHDGPQVPFWLVGGNTGDGGIKAPEGAIKSILEIAEETVDINYLLDTILLKGYLYLLTGPTGTGKTAIALLMGLCVATGREFAGLETSKGKVLYLAGENPLDVQCRIIAALKQLNIDPHDIKNDFHMLRGVEPLGFIKIYARNYGYDLIIVDTLPAYFNGDDSNSNDQVKAFARDQLRPLCELANRPTVLALCHPTKTASKDFNIPYGGGALINEVDGNLALWGSGDDPKELYTCGKFRGPQFESLYFKLEEATHERIIDNKGRQIPTVLAAHVTEQESEQAFKRARQNENDLLSSMIHHPRMSMPKRAVHLKWLTRKGKPAISKIVKMLMSLENDKLVGRNRYGWFLTKRGKEAAHGIAENEAY